MEEKNDITMITEALVFMRFENPEGFVSVLAKIIDRQMEEICRLINEDNYEEGGRVND